MHNNMQIPPRILKMANLDIDEILDNTEHLSTLGLAPEDNLKFKTLRYHDNYNLDRWLRNPNSLDNSINSRYLASDKLQHFLYAYKKWYDTATLTGTHRIEAFNAYKHLEAVTLPKMKKAEASQIKTEKVLSSSLKKDKELKEAKLKLEKEKLLLELQTQQKARLIRLGISISLGILIALIFQLCDK